MRTPTLHNLRVVPFGANPNLLLILYFAFKTVPFIVCAFSIYLGYHLFILGVTGAASLSINAKTINGQLLNAAPGLFFAVGGIVGLIMSIRKGVDIEFQSEVKEVHKKDDVEYGRGGGGRLLK